MISFEITDHAMAQLLIMERDGTVPKEAPQIGSRQMRMVRDEYYRLAHLGLTRVSDELKYCY